MTLAQFNKHAIKLCEEAGHRVAALDLFYALPDVAECMQEMAFIMWKAPEGSFFFTSDKPLMLQSRTNGIARGVGWANKNALGLIALCPSLYLTMFYHDPPRVYLENATPQQVGGLNIETLRFAYREVYAPFKHTDAQDWMMQVGRWSSTA